MIDWKLNRGKQPVTKGTMIDIMYYDDVVTCDIIVGMVHLSWALAGDPDDILCWRHAVSIQYPEDCAEMVETY